jgi:GNAT superfamily N-acetyltransferase
MTEDAMAISDWSDQNGRVIHLQPNHKNIESQYVTEIIGKMEMEFGVEDDHKNSHIYLAVYDSKIVGISTVKEQIEAQKEEEKKIVRLGIQRLFVRPDFRRKGFARAMLKSILIMHHKGEMLSLTEDVAFSTPTEDGRKLIKSVAGSDNFFVFTS